MQILWAFIITVFTLTSLPAQNAGHNQFLKLIPEAEEGDFGSAVDIEGDWVMISAEDATVDGISSGTVYVYNKSSGTPIIVKKLVSSDASGLNRFGNALSIENSTMVVGAWAKSGVSGSSTIAASGKVYIFEKDAGGVDNWGEVKDIQAPNPAAFEYFGFSVDIGDNVIAVSGHRNSDLASVAGKVYLYGRNTGGVNNWGFIKAVTQVGGAANYQFGTWVEVSDDYLFVTSNDFNNEGKVHLYHKNEGGPNNWGYIKSFASDDPATNRFFGDETSLYGDEILISGFRDINSNAFNTGRAFLYQKDEGGINNWGLVKIFEPSITEIDAEYGVSVDLNGDYIIIGAEEESTVDATDAGAAYIYHRNEGGTDNWGLVNKVFSCDADEEDELGTAVAIDGGQAVIGADDDSEAFEDAGAAYIFQQSTNPLMVNNTLINTTNFLQYHTGMTLTSDAQINKPGDTARFRSSVCIELKNDFTVGPSTLLECIIDACN